MEERDGHSIREVSHPLPCSPFPFRHLGQANLIPALRASYTVWVTLIVARVSRGHMSPPKSSAPGSTSGRNRCLLEQANDCSVFSSPMKERGGDMG